MKKISIVVITGTAILMASVLQGCTLFKKEIAVVWKEDFNSPVSGKSSIPQGWKRRGKIGTRRAVFLVEKNAKEKGAFLHMEADKASTTLITSVRGVSLRKTPILRWRWRATTLPEGADSRVEAKDDQAIGIYVGTGNMLNKKTVSYRWDTDTPKEAEGNCVYGKGTIKVKWYTLRNKKDAKNGKWYVEQRNCAEDFKKAWGFYPKKIYLSISCNSQYTGTKAVADLDWIEFASASGNLKGGS